MAPPRQVHDPFTDAPLRPTTSNATNPSLRTQNSQQSLRSNASSASTRTRPPQQRDLFAPALSRKPTSRSTPRVEDEVLADSDSDREWAGQRHAQLRRARHGSPEGKNSRLKAKQDEEAEFVNRRPDGTYLLGVAGFGDAVAVPQMSAPKTDEEMSQAGRSLHEQGLKAELTPCRG